MSAPDAVLAPPPAKVRLARLYLGLALLGAAIVAKTGGEVLNRYRFAFNETESLPYWAFIADQARRTPRRGQLVVFVPPANPFYPSGMAFGKIVGGVPGDLVERRGQAVFVNGRFIGVAKTHAQDGRPVAPGPVGRIPPGRYFVYTPHRDSLDSRYAVVGWIPQSRILGLATPVM
jgi:conjugal transfer pilin signal peptidase TrbI